MDGREWRGRGRVERWRGEGGGEGTERTGREEGMERTDREKGMALVGFRGRKMRKLNGIKAPKKRNGLEGPVNGPQSPQRALLRPLLENWGT